MAATCRAGAKGARIISTTTHATDGQPRAPGASNRSQELTPTFQMPARRFGGILPAVSNSPVTSLYVHVPFCAHKCEYCAFFSEASSGELMNRYVNALLRE